MNARRVFVSLTIFVIVFSSVFAVFTAKAQAGAMIATPSLVNIGEQIAVVWALKEPSGNDWISMHRASGPDSEVLAWQKATPTTDGDGKGGVLYFQATQAGDFQFRFFRNGERYMVSNTVTVINRVSQATNVPFGGGPEAQPTVNSGGVPPWDTARQSNVEGGVNLSIVCANLGYPDVVNLDNTADGWRCKNGGTLFMLDWRSICARVYGSDYVGVKISNNIDGWRCKNGDTTSQSQSHSLPADCSGVLTPHLIVGQQATVVTADGVNLRAGEGTSQPKRGELNQGDVITVIGGPRCKDGYQWWQVQTVSQGTWWVAEGDTNYWLENGGNFVLQSTQIPVGDTGTVTGDCDRSRPIQLHLGDIAQAKFNTNLRADAGMNQPIRDLMPDGSTGVTVGGPKCVDGLVWFQIQTTHGTWWTTESVNGKYVLVKVASQPQPTIVPTATLVPPTAVPPTDTPVPQQPIQPAQPDQNSSGGQNQFASGCLETYVDPATHNGDVYADAGSCVNYVVDHGYQALWTCMNQVNPPAGYVDSGGAARYWADWSRSASQHCNLSVNPTQSGVANLDVVNQGDVVVWQPGCEGAYSPGHVAIFERFTDSNKKHMLVDEGNWASADHIHEVHSECMTFIHLNVEQQTNQANSGGNQQPSGQGTITQTAIALSITWSFCLACTSEAWIIFEVPRDHYNFTGFKLTFVGAEVTTIGVPEKVGENGDKDKISIHVSAAEIQRLIDNNHGGQTNNASNWSVTYTAK